MLTTDVMRSIDAEVVEDESLNCLNEITPKYAPNNTTKHKD